MKSIVQSRLQQMTVNDVIAFASQSGFSLTLPEADLIRQTLTQKKYDIFDPSSQKILLSRLSKDLSPDAIKFINKMSSDWL